MHHECRPPPVCWSSELSSDLAIYLAISIYLIDTIFFSALIWGNSLQMEGQKLALSYLS